MQQIDYTKPVHAYYLTYDGQYGNRRLFPGGLNRKGTKMYGRGLGAHEHSYDMGRVGRRGFWQLENLRPLNIYAPLEMIYDDGATRSSLHVHLITDDQIVVDGVAYDLTGLPLDRPVRSWLRNVSPPSLVTDFSAPLTDREKIAVEVLKKAFTSKIDWTKPLGICRSESSYAYAFDQTTGKRRTAGEQVFVINLPPVVDWTKPLEFCTDAGDALPARLLLLEDSAAWCAYSTVGGKPLSDRFEPSTGKLIDSSGRVLEAFFIRNKP